MEVAESSEFDNFPSASLKARQLLLAKILTQPSTGPDPFSEKKLPKCFESDINIRQPGSSLPIDLHVRYI